MSRARLRDQGITVGDLPPGPHNAITDVVGVRVGHTTLVSGEGPLRAGEGPVRTGVTVILPHEGSLFRQKVRAAVHTINGFGKVLGFEQVRELGLIEAPIALTNTLNVGLVADAVVQDAVRQNPDIGVHTGSVNVVVGETNDGYLNDLQGRHVRAEHVWLAIATASAGPVEEGAVSETFETVRGPTYYTNGLMAKESHTGEIGQWQNGKVEVIGPKGIEATLNNYVSTADTLYPKPVWPK